MNIVIFGVVCFVAGLLAGWQLTWWRMQRVWQRYPYQFQAIVNGVIKKRIAEGRLKPLEEMDNAH